MKIKARLLSLILSLTMAVTMLAVPASAATFNPVVNTITSASDPHISEILASIDDQSFTSPSAKTVKDYIFYFIFDSKYAAIGGENFPYTNEAGYTSTVSDGTYTISGINGSGCFAYAKFGMNVIYGKTGAALSQGEKAGSMTAPGVEKFLRTYAQAGEHIRVGNSHSVMFVACDPVGFYYLDTWDNYHVRLHYATFYSFANACNAVNTACILYNANTNLNDPDKQDTFVGEGESTLTISPTRYPSDQVVLGSFNLRGTVSSNYPIVKFSGAIYNADGTVNQSKTEVPNVPSLDIAESNVNIFLRFGSLTVGESYYLVYTAVDSSGKTVVWSSDVFTIIANSTEVSTLSISAGEYPKGIIKPQAYTLTGYVTSNYDITSVSGFIYSENGDMLQSASRQNLNTKEFKIENSGIDNSLKFGELPDGRYYITYAATDASDNSVTWNSPIFTVRSGSLDNSNIGNGGVVTDSTLTIKATKYPTGNLDGVDPKLDGYITSNYAIVSVDAAICSAEGYLVRQAVTQTPHSTYFELDSTNVINDQLNFATLRSGYYYVRYEATDASGKTMVWKSPVIGVNGRTLFTDVTDPALWYYNTVYHMASKGIVDGTPNGDGTMYFDPNGSLTRVQAVVLLYKTECSLKGTPDVSGVTLTFQDTPLDWYQNAIKWAYKNGITTGLSSTEFAPNKLVSREELACYLYRYSKAQPVSSDYISSYADASLVRDYAVEAMNWCVSEGIITSVTTGQQTLNPGGGATRSQAATMFERAFF